MSISPGISASADAGRLALEVIATLVNVKASAADHLLRRAGVTDDLIRRFLTERDPATGKKRSKREAGALLLGGLAKSGGGEAVVRNLIAIAAHWDAFYLAQDEYKARAVVQKAREIQGILAEEDTRERIEQERRAQAAADRVRREKQANLPKQSELLLAQFDQASLANDSQRRGYLLEDLLNRLFDLHGFPVARAFRRNNGGEQIDGAFEMEGLQYIVECRWRVKLSDICDLDSLAGKVGRSGRQTMGLFLSINGWSGNIPGLLKQNPSKSMILMEGCDLRSVLDQRADLRRLMKAKVQALNLDAEPYFPVSRLMADD